MNAFKILALILILAGALALGYGGFSYTRKTQQAKIGNIELTVKEKQPVNIPVWAGVGLVVVGVGLLFLPSKK